MVLCRSQPERVSETPAIRALSLDVGSHPQARRLNPQFSPEAPLLRLRVEVSWDPRDASTTLFGLEGRLARLSPTLARHQCRGHHDYRILRTLARDTGGPPRLGRDFEPSLALAHVLEHLIIDAVSFLTGAPIVSGATGALRGVPHRYDVFVECPDPALARLVVALPLSWLSSLAAGGSLDGEGWTTLVVARHLYLRRHAGPCDPVALSRRLMRSPGEVEAALRWLERNGFACRVGYTMNFSGVEYCRLKTASSETSASLERPRPPRPRDDTEEGEPPRATGAPG